MPGLIVIVQDNPHVFDRNRELVRKMAELISHEPFYRTRFMESPELGLQACRVYLDHDYAADVIGSNGDGTIQCLLSGELFGMRELLGKLGDAHSSLCDPHNHSEIAARLYEQHGETMLRWLNGYFNLLIIDKRDRSVLVANDRFGMQRFYHARLPDGGMMFAPEVKCFKLIPDLKLTLDTTAVVHSFRHDCLLNNATFYKEVRRFPISTSFRLKGGDCLSCEYWGPESELEKPRLAPNEFLDSVIGVFESVVADYYTPQITALSFTGGLDTRAILSVLSHRGLSPPLFTFGGMYRDSHDVKIARRLAAMNGNSWGVIRLGRDFLDNFERWATKAIYVSDGIARLNTCHEYYLNLAARDFGRVRLTGKYGSQIIRGVTMLKDRSPNLGIFSTDFKRHYHNTVSEIRWKDRSALLREELPQLEGARHTQEMTALTVRTPYMDNRLIDVTLRAPRIEDTALLQKKIYLKNTPHLAGIPTNRGELAGGGLNLAKLYYKTLNFVDSVYNWEKLPRWALPVCRSGDLTGISRIFVGRSEWIHHRKWFTGELKDFARNLILDPTTRGRHYYNGSALEKMMNLHFSGKANYTPEIIKIGSFEIWCRQSDSPQ
ncbi:MAG: hypothetical protein JSV52_14435 [Candidatus Zixiibacteriota bacterium]|nr:MAG: hypothetical protein JSV52_14435 [candidate division Zixibacteria bacterium]